MGLVELGVEFDWTKKRKRRRDTRLESLRWVRYVVRSLPIPFSIQIIGFRTLRALLLSSHQKKDRRISIAMKLEDQDLKRKIYLNESSGPGILVSLWTLRGLRACHIEIDFDMI